MKHGTRRYLNEESSAPPHCRAMSTHLAAAFSSAKRPRAKEKANHAADRRVDAGHMFLARLRRTKCDLGEDRDGEVSCEPAGATSHWSSRSFSLTSSQGNS